MCLRDHFLYAFRYNPHPHPLTTSSCLWLVSADFVRDHNFPFHACLSVSCVHAQDGPVSKVGGSSIYIESLVPGGPADRGGILRPGYYPFFLVELCSYHNLTSPLLSSGALSCDNLTLLHLSSGALCPAMIWHYLFFLVEPCRVTIWLLPHLSSGALSCDNLTLPHLSSGALCPAMIWHYLFFLVEPCRVTIWLYLICLVEPSVLQWSDTTSSF